MKRDRIDTSKNTVITIGPAGDGFLVKVDGVDVPEIYRDVEELGRDIVQLLKDPTHTPWDGKVIPPRPPRQGGPAQGPAR